MIIDAHNHPDWHGHNLDRFLQNMEECNIDVTWILPWECPPGEGGEGYAAAVPPLDDQGPIPFSRALSYKERAPEKFVLGYCPDPRDPLALGKMQAAIDIYGAQVCGEWKVRMLFDNPDALALYRLCGDRGVPVTFHLDYPFLPDPEKITRPVHWYGGSLAAVERALQACPDTIFLGHGPGFWAHISGDDGYKQGYYPKGPVEPGGELLRLLDEYPNMWCDMSAFSGHGALNRDHDFTRQFLIDYQDRVLYARDYFDKVHQELINSLGLPEDVLEKIYSGNALRLAPLT
jgi:hypothetical protein